MSYLEEATREYWVASQRLSGHSEICRIVARSEAQKALLRIVQYPPSTRLGYLAAKVGAAPTPHGPATPPTTPPTGPQGAA